MSNISERAHVYEKHQQCTDVNCLICVGGLHHCTACGGWEGELLPECPGMALTRMQHGENYESYLKHFRSRLKTINFAILHRQDG